MKKDRAYIMLTVFSVCMFLLLGRFFYYQIVKGDSYSKYASTQRVTDSEVEKPRGDILDRNGISFTNRNNKVILALKPLYLRENPDDISKLGWIVGEDYYKLKHLIDLKKEPILYEIDSSKKLLLDSMDIQGISAINSLKRYDTGTLARHVLGYLNSVDSKGQTGIERFYDDVLSYDKEDTVGVVTDARDNLLQGMGYRLIRSEGYSEKLNVKLTLDYHIQKIVEDTMNRRNTQGAVIVQDVNSGDIVAAASKPDFNQNRVDDFLDSPGKELFNKAVASYNLGSIFKIIDVAQAVESGMDLSEQYYCPGYAQVGDSVFQCVSFSRGGHGNIGLSDAFALSCNTYFIKMGIEIGSNGILDMAARFGLGKLTGVKNQGVEESAGKLPPDDNSYTYGDIANISIGQGEVLATPLQVANMVSTIANGGIFNQINIVDSIVDEDGNKVRDMRIKHGNRIISRETAEIIQDMMEKVVDSGTGTNARLDEYGGAAGKTGSAETGQVMNGEPVVQAWFAGYFPVTAPRYAIAVFVENGRRGNDVAAPVFVDIASEIMKKKL